MSAPPDLTLLVLRLIQGAPRPPVREWFLLPELVDATQAAARERLESARKPVIVAPLLEPGCVGLWAVADLDPDARIGAERELANRSAYFEAKLRETWPDGVDAVRLSEGDAELSVAIETFRAWVRDYYIAVGHGLERERDPRVARLTIRPPGGGRRPIGLPVEFRDASAIANEQGHRTT